MLNILVDKQDLEEIENNYDELSKFLTSNFASFSACAFVLQTVMDAVDKAKERLGEEPEKLKEGGVDCMDEDAKQASIPYTYNTPQHDWKCGYPDVTGQRK